MLKGPIPVARRHDPLAGSDLPLLDFLGWLAILGILALGVSTAWFFMAAHRGLSVGFLVITILFSLMWRAVAQGLGEFKLDLTIAIKNDQAATDDQSSAHRHRASGSGGPIRFHIPNWQKKMYCTGIHGHLSATYLARRRCYQR
jgi:hypothetical protein